MDPRTLFEKDYCALMDFRLKLIFWVVILELTLLAVVGVIVSSNMPASGWDFSSPIFYQVGLASLFLGAMVAVVVSLLTAREIARRTGAIQEGWERSLRILQSIPAGIVIVDPRNHKIIEANKAALEAFKAPKSKVVGQDCHKYLCPAEKNYCPITDLGQESDGSERLIVTDGGVAVPVFKTVDPIELGGKKLLLETFFDISDRIELERRLRDAYTQQQNMVNYDLLTCTLNRRAISKHAEAELARAERGGGLSVLMMDLDHFKQINDTHGHLVGDDVLKLAASVVTKNLRPYDWIGRWGGEEFLILLPNTSMKTALDVAERLRSSIQAASLPLSDGGRVQFTASFGLASMTEMGKNFVRLESIVSLADEALYHAKHEGRNKVCVPVNGSPR